MINDKLKLFFGKKEKKLTHTHTHVYLSCNGNGCYCCSLFSILYSALSLFTYICVCVEHISEDI